MALPGGGSLVIDEAADAFLARVPDAVVSLWHRADGETGREVLAAVQDHADT